MPPRNHIRPERDLIQNRVRDVVRSIYAYYSSKKRPGAESPGLQGGYFRMGGNFGDVVGVDLGGVGESDVGLDGVAY